MAAPLIVITADRPPELQGAGANQSIDQQRLYGSAVRWFVDPGAPVELPNAARLWRRLAARAYAEAANGPVHLNLPFREPLVPPPGHVPAPLGVAGQSISRGRLLPSPSQVAALASALQRAQRPLGCAGRLYGVRNRCRRISNGRSALSRCLDRPRTRTPRRVGAGRQSRSGRQPPCRKSVTPEPGGPGPPAASSRSCRMVSRSPCATRAP